MNTRIVTELDALKRLPAESRRGLPASLATLLTAVLLSSSDFDPTGDHAFKGEL